MKCDASSRGTLPIFASRLKEEFTEVKRLNVILETYRKYL